MIDDAVGLCRAATVCTEWHDAVRQNSEALWRALLLVHYPLLPPNEGTRRPSYRLACNRYRFACTGSFELQVLHGDELIPGLYGSAAWTRARYAGPNMLVALSTT